MAVSKSKKSGKDPAFLFYPNDYIGGTMGMTFEEKGAYMEVLMLQFNRGRMTTLMVGQLVGQLWINIQVKFKQDDKGLWYNERLEEEQKKRQSFTNSRKNNLSGKNQYTSKAVVEVGHKTSLMEDEDENENIDSNNNNSLFINTLLKNENWKKSIIDKFKITTEEVDLKLNEFHTHLKTELKEHPSMNEFAKHFKNWLPVNKEKNGKINNTGVPAKSFSKNR